MTNFTNSQSDIDLVNGDVLLVNKPLKLTSFDVVKEVRWACKKNLNVRKYKVGHAGTLDPLADGLLILCIGRKTKTIAELTSLSKTYTGIITLGATTPSYDLETEVNAVFSTENISNEDIISNAESFLGKQLQTPPSHSAKWVNGKRAYELARKGEEVNLKQNEVEISQFNITKIDMPHIHFEIECTKGTYIRSIANDFGARLDNGGHLSKLTRTKIDNFDLKDAYELNSLKEKIINQ